MFLLPASYRLLALNLLLLGSAYDLMKHTFACALNTFKCSYGFSGGSLASVR